MRVLGFDVVSIVGHMVGITVGFLLLRYSVVYTDESLFLFYLLFVYRFAFNRRCYIDKLKIFACE